MSLLDRLGEPALRPQGVVFYSLEDLRKALTFLFDGIIPVREPGRAAGILITRVQQKPHFVEMLLPYQPKDMVLVLVKTRERFVLKFLSSETRSYLYPRLEDRVLSEVSGSRRGLGSAELALPFNWCGRRSYKIDVGRMLAAINRRIGLMGVTEEARERLASIEAEKVVESLAHRERRPEPGGIAIFSLMNRKVNGDSCLMGIFLDAATRTTRVRSHKVCWDVRARGSVLHARSVPHYSKPTRPLLVLHLETRNLVGEEVLPLTDRTVIDTSIEFVRAVAKDLR